jgi:oxaloacetate decarboxylase alpha subunit
LSKVEILAPLPALVVEIPVNEGDRVNAGDTVALLTVMKKETEVKAEAAGIVTAINVKPEDVVDAGAPLLVLETDSV